MNKYLSNIVSINFVLLTFIVMVLPFTPNSHAQGSSDLPYNQQTEIEQKKFLKDYLKGFVKSTERGKQSLEEKYGYPVFELVSANVNASTDTVYVKIKYLIDDYDASAVAGIPLSMCSKPGMAYIINQGIKHDLKYLDPQDKVLLKLTLTKEYCEETLLENGVTIDKLAYDKIASDFATSSNSPSYNLGYQAGTFIGYLLVFLLIIGFIVFAVKKSKNKYE